MTREYQAVPFPIFGGLDTKTDGVSLPAPKLQKAENVHSDKTGSLRRRPGRTAISNTIQDGTSASGWLASGTYQGRLLGFAQSKLYEYSQSDLAWVDKGRCTSWRESYASISSTSSSIGALGASMDMGVLGNYKVYAYDTFVKEGANTRTSTVFTMVDLYGTSYCVDKVLATTTGATGGSGVRVIGNQGFGIVIVFYDISTANTLKCLVIDTSSRATINTSIDATPTSLATNCDKAVFDAEINTTYGPFVAYQQSAANTISFGHVTAAGALTHTSTTTSGAAHATRIAVDVHSSNAMHGIFFSLGTTPADGYADLRSFDGAVWTATASSAAVNGALAATIVHVACKFDSATVLRVFYDGDIHTLYACVRHATVDTAAVVTDQGFLTRSYLASKPFLGADGTLYYWATNEPLTGVVQPTLFLMDYSNTFCGIANPGVHVGPSLSFIPRVVNDFNGKNSALFQYYTAFGTLGTGSATAFREVSLDMVHSDSHVTVEDGSCTYIPSAALQQYDGVSCVEVGFTQFCDTAGRVGFTKSNGAGSLTNLGVYSYRIVPEWTNAKGEREQGTDNGPTTITMGAADDTVAIQIDNVPWTLKWTALKPARQNFCWAIYRTATGAVAPTADSPHYRVGTVQNVPTEDVATFTDLMSDATAATQEELYADVELSNLIPSPGYIVAAGNGRVFLSGLPEDPSLVLFSKQRGHGQPLAFNPALSIQMPQSAGDVTSLAVLDEQLVAFTRDTIYRVVGDGPTNTGAGAGYAPPVVAVSADGGATSHRGVALTTIGLVYQSVRGIMLFSPGLEGTYIGAPLEGLYDGSAITGIQTVPQFQRIHFSTATQTYVFDYYHKQWYIWTHVSDGPTSLWEDIHVSLSNDQFAYDDTGVWTDAGTAYTTTVTLAWEKSSSTQGDVAFRRIGITGTSLDQHYLDVRFSQDYNGTVNQTDDSTIAAAGVLRKRIRVARQKANSLQITIRDAFVDAYGTDVVLNTAGWRLNEVVFEVKVRGGLSHRRIG